MEKALKNIGSNDMILTVTTYWKPEIIYLTQKETIKKDKYHLLAVWPSDFHVNSVVQFPHFWSMNNVNTSLRSFGSIKWDDGWKIPGLCWNMVQAQWLLGEASHLSSTTSPCFDKHGKQYFLKAGHHLLMCCEINLMGCYKHIYMYLFLF